MNVFVGIKTLALIKQTAHFFSLPHWSEKVIADDRAHRKI